MVRRRTDSTSGWNGCWPTSPAQNGLSIRLQTIGRGYISCAGSSRSTTVEVLETYIEKAREDGFQDVVLFVDYLQKVPYRPPIGAPEPDTTQRIGHVVSGLKDVALATGVPIVAVAASDEAGCDRARSGWPTCWGRRWCSMSATWVSSRIHTTLELMAGRPSCGRLKRTVADRQMSAQFSLSTVNSSISITRYSGCSRNEQDDRKRIPDRSSMSDKPRFETARTTRHSVETDFDSPCLSLRLVIQVRT